MSSPQSFEVEWYRKYGKYPDRITHDNHGQPYVIGDSSWRNKNPNRPEHVEEQMRDAREMQEGKRL